MTQQQTPQASPPQAPAKRSRSWLWALLGLAIAGVVSLLAAYWPTAQSASTTHTVVYQAEADAAHGSGRTGSYTIQTDNGGTSQGVTSLPLLNQAGGTGLTFTSFHTGDFVYLSVQNQDAAGSVTCRITVDGVVLSENTSSGGYVIASCQGRVP